jgi:hypothetical protein
MKAEPGRAMSSGPEGMPLALKSAQARNPRLASMLFGPRCFLSDVARGLSEQNWSNRAGTAAYIGEKLT